MRRPEYWRKRAFQLALALLVTSLPAACQTHAVCPWINVATASGVLGGEATLSLTNPSPTVTTCRFDYKSGEEVRELTVQITAMTDLGKDYALFKAMCGGDATPLRAIGNEAVMCPDNNPGTAHSERVVSRVRNSAFVLRLSTTAKSSPVMTQDSIEEKLRFVAELEMCIRDRALLHDRLHIQSLNIGHTDGVKLWDHHSESRKRSVSYTHL